MLCCLTLFRSGADMKKQSDHCAHVAAMFFDEVSHLISVLGNMMHQKDQGQTLRFLGYAKEDFKKAMREFKRAGGWHE